MKNRARTSEKLLGKAATGQEKPNHAATRTWRTADEEKDPGLTPDFEAELDHDCEWGHRSRD